MAEKKTPTGLNELPSQNNGSIDIMAELNKMLSTPPPTVDSFDAPTPSALPDTPPQLEKGMSTKIGRAIAVAMVGMNNPEQGMAMIKQFQAEDESAKNEVQQRFANEMAIAQAQQQRIAFTQDVKQAQRDDAQEDASLRIRVIEAAIRKLDMEASANGSAGTNDPKYHTQRQLMLDALGAAQAEQGIDEKTSINEGLEDITGQIKGAISAGLPDSDVASLASGSSEEKAAIINKIKAFRKATLAPTKVKETPQLASIRRTFEVQAAMRPGDAEAQLLLSTYHQAVQNLPDPVINDPGDMAKVSAAAAQMLQLNPGAFNEVGEAIAQKILGQGMAANMEEAEEMAAEIMAEVITTDDLTNDLELDPTEPGGLEKLNEKRKAIFNPDGSFTPSAKKKIKNVLGLADRPTSKGKVIARKQGQSENVATLPDSLFKPHTVVIPVKKR